MLLYIPVIGLALHAVALAMHFNVNQLVVTAPCQVKVQMSRRAYDLKVTVEMVIEQKWYMGVDVKERLFPLCWRCTGTGRDAASLPARKAEVKIENKPLGQSLPFIEQAEGCSEAQLVVAQCVHVKAAQQLALAVYLRDIDGRDLRTLLNYDPGTR